MFTLITSDGSRWSFETDGPVDPTEERAILCNGVLPVNPAALAGNSFPRWRVNGSAVVAWMREDEVTI